LLHGALATGEDVVELDVLMLDEERGNGDDEEEDEHGRLLGEPRDENNNNDDNNLNSDSTQPYDWPDDSQLPAIDALPTVIDLLESSQLPSQPTPSQQAPSQPKRSAISLRKRSSRNATEADGRKRKKSSGHALADALGEATSEIKASQQLLIDIRLTSTARSRAAKILVSEFGNVSGRDQDLLYAAIVTEGQADLFIARSPEQRRDWVHRTLLVAKGLPADEDQSAAVGHGADVRRPHRRS